MSDKNLNIPLLPLRDVVIFPTVVTPLFVGRENLSQHFRLQWPEINK